MGILRRILLAGSGGSFVLMTDLSHLVFDVKAYGATGDGTTDDTTGVQSAITAACVDGGIVWFPPGTYLVDTTLTIACDGVTLAGAGPNASIIKADTGLDAANVIHFDGGVGCGMEDLQVTSASVKSGGAGLYIDGCFRFAAEGLLFTNQYDSIRMTDSTIVRITASDLYHQSRHGILIDGAGNDIYLAKIVADNTPDATGGGIQVLGGDAVLAENCDFIHFANGLVIGPPTGKAARWHFYTACAFDTSTNDGIHIGGDAGTIYGHTFVNCWSASNTNQGVLIDQATGTLAGISFEDGRVFNNGQSGFLLTEGSRITISGNAIVSNSTSSSGTYNGIDVAAGITHLTVNGNQAYNGLAQPSTQGYGLSFVSGATDYVIAQGNNFVGNATGGIENQAGVTGVNLSISGNLV